ncbi:hypothetical protein Scep_025054 [Stephania cephalantha]|uniref:Uncharacterized protein n=1 Tax=Stephania cephalantha TaxID=152367 RepID=A0AAP0HZ67_9MAGN
MADLLKVKTMRMLLVLAKHALQMVEASYVQVLCRKDWRLHVHTYDAGVDLLSATTAPRV